MAGDAARVLVESHIPADMWAALLPHQQAGVLAGVRRGGRLLLADEMGLGKTAQVWLGLVGLKPSRLSGFSWVAVLCSAI